MAATANTSLHRIIKLDIPNEEYYVTTFRPGDETSVQEILSIDSVNHNLIKVQKPYTAADAEFWVSHMVASADELLSFSSVEERNRRFFAQENPIPLQAIRYGGEEGRFVGCISLTPRVGAGIVDLGYYLHPIHQRKGVMVAAGAAVVRWARDEFGVTRVYSSADCMNPGSGKVIERVAAKTSVGEVKEGEKILSWPVEKVVTGRKVDSLSRTWEWSV